MKKHFTAKQKKAIEYLALANMTQTQMAEQLKVQPQTISKWKHLPGFMEAVLDRARELLKESIPDVYDALKEEAKAGKDRHIKILLDHIEKIEDVRSKRTSITFSWEMPTLTEEADDGE